MVTFLSQALRYAVIYIFGVTGVSVNEKGGHLNMGIPGIVCLGVLGSLLGAWAVTSGVPVENINPFLVFIVPTLLGMLFAAIGGFVFSLFAVTLKCNQNVTGLVITTFCGALVSYFINTIPSDAISGIAKAGEIAMHLFSNYKSFGVFGEIFLSQSIYFYLAIIIAIVVSIFLVRTRIGLNLRACGENPAAADAVGINVSLYRYMSTIVSALIVGLGGVAYQMDYSSGLFNANNPYDSYGWLALSLVILSNWKPWIGIFVGICFSALSICGLYINIPVTYAKLFEIVPYLLAIIVLVLTSIFNSKKVGGPSALGQTYFREDR